IDRSGLASAGGDAEDLGPVVADDLFREPSLPRERLTTVHGLEERWKVARIDHGSPPGEASPSSAIGRNNPIPWNRPAPRRIGPFTGLQKRSTTCRRGRSR